MRVRQTGVGLSHVGVVASGHHTSRFEPVPGSTRVTSATAHREALEETTASGSIFRGHQSCVTRLHAATIVKSFGGTKCPARPTARLVTDVANHVSTLGEGSAGVPVGRNIRKNVLVV